MIGERIKRIEDPALLRGAAVFVDDIHLAGMLEVAFLRSSHPHAKILSINTTAAKAKPGVRAVYTLEDLSPHLQMDRLPLQFPTTAFRPDVTPWLLAGGEVCHVGEAIAMVVADTRYIAEDAVTVIDVDYDPLPSVAGCAAAFAKNAPQVHEGRDDNVLVRFGQSYGDANDAFANAEHVFRERFVQHRGAAHPIEARGAVARYDEMNGSTTLWSSTQMSHEVRSAIVQMFGVDEGRIRVVAPDVGGTERARALGKLLNIGLAIVDKRRPKPGKSQVMNVIGDVKGKTCLIVDDIIDSGGTIVNAAKALKKRGAKEVYVYITHGVLSGDAVKKIKGSVIKNLVITDTIDNNNKIKGVKNIEVLPISGLMGEAIKRISNSTSVSDLFK